MDTIEEHYRPHYNFWDKLIFAISGIVIGGTIVSSIAYAVYLLNAETA